MSRLFAEGSLRLLEVGMWRSKSQGGKAAVRHLAIPNLDPAAPMRLKVRPANRNDHLFAQRIKISAL